MSILADAHPRADARQRAWLWSEFLCLFGVLPILCATRVWPWHPMLLLVPVGVLAVVWHIRTLPSKGELLLLPEPRRNLANIALLFLILASALFALLLLWLPEGRLFWLPRHRPEIWIAVMLLYPLLSVIPQELFFRAFLFRRYAPILPTPVGIVIASTLAFAWVHIIFGNWIAPVLTIPGGIIFSLRYLHTRSLLLTSLEHALWGAFLLSVGLERYFITNAARLLVES